MACVSSRNIPLPWHTFCRATPIFLNQNLSESNMSGSQITSSEVSTNRFSSRCQLRCWAACHDQCGNMGGDWWCHLWWLAGAKWQSTGPPVLQHQNLAFFGSESGPPKKLKLQTSMGKWCKMYDSGVMIQIGPWQFWRFWAEKMAEHFLFWFRGHTKFRASKVRNERRNVCAQATGETRRSFNHPCSNRASFVAGVLPTWEH